MKADIGMGSLSAGMFEIKASNAFGGKSFGVLGQGNPKRDSSNVNITDGDAMNGFTLTQQPTTQTCKPKVMSITVSPKRARNAAEIFAFKIGAWSWFGYDFTTPT